MTYTRSHRIPAFLLAVIMLLALIPVISPVTAFAEEDGEWTYVVENGKATITSFRGTGKTISVPAKVGTYAVSSVKTLSANYSKANITSVSFAAGIKVLESSVLSGYTSLTRVTLPETITTIGDNAFENCTSLTAITIPNSVTSIGVGAFSGCTSLFSANISCMASTIPSKVFYNCKKLSSLTLPANATSVGDLAFAGCESLVSISLPDGVKSIGKSAFSECTKLASIPLPSELKTIDELAFYKCTSLTSVFLPEKVKTIESEAFKACSSLKTVYLSPSVTTLKSGVFADIEGIESLVFGGGYVNLNNIFTTGNPTVYYLSKYSSEWAKYSGVKKGTYAPITGVSINCKTSAQPGDNISVKISAVPSSCDFKDSYVVRSSNPLVAYFTQEGTLSAKTAGKTTITVVTVNGVTETKDVEIKPAAPTGVKASSKTINSADLTWKAVSGVSGYAIYRATSQNGTYKRLGTSITTSYSDKGLTKGKTYYYKVVSYVSVSGSTINSDYSDTISVSATSPAPTTVSAAKSKSGVATVKWSKSVGANGYEVYMATSSGGKYSKIATITSASTLSYKKTGLKAGKTYYFKVRSYVTVSGKKVYSPYTKVVKAKV